MTLTNVDRKYKLTFISTIIFGLLSQGMGLFNKYSYHDDIMNMFTVGSTTVSGRWMLELLSKIELFIFGDGHFSLPLFNGILAIIYIGLIACVIIKLLDIKNNVLCILIGGIMVVFPVITGMFAFMFTVRQYMFALLIGVIGLFLALTNNKWWIKVIGIILISCSIGIYQAFIPVYLSLIVIYLIKETNTDDNTYKDVLKKIGLALAYVASFMILYFVINKIALSITNSTLTEYQGIKNMGQDSIVTYLKRAYYACCVFLLPSKDSMCYMYFGNIQIVYYLLMLVGVILFVMLFTNIYKKDKIKGIILVVLFVCIPLATNFIFVMVNPGQVHSLMVYGQVMLFVLLAWLIDKEYLELEKVSSYVKKVGTILLLLVSVMYIRVDNECYLKAEITQEQTISYFTTLITRIKSVEGYDDEYPVSFVFKDGGRIDDLSMTNFDQFNDLTVYPYYEMYRYVNNYEWKDFMKVWCGYSVNIDDGADIKDTKEVSEMNCYPDDGSIKVIDNRVVVRFK